MFSDPYHNTNPYIQDSFLGSKYFNLDFWGDKAVSVLSYIYNNFFTKGALENIYTILSVFSLFFVAVIVYATIRMFEIREKEHRHMHHEVVEYAHKHRNAHLANAETEGGHNEHKTQTNHH